MAQETEFERYRRFLQIHEIYNIPKEIFTGDSNYSSALFNVDEFKVRYGIYHEPGSWGQFNQALNYNSESSIMGCDIHLVTQVRRDGKWESAPIETEPFNYRSYGLFGFLANVRNYSEVPPISPPKGLPDDFDPPVKDYNQSGPDIYEYDSWLQRDNVGSHSHSWLTLKELVEYNYDQVFWDKRVTRQIGPNSWDGAATAMPGEGRYLTVREFLGEQFWDDLTDLLFLQESYNPEDIRIVFCFDN